MKKSTSILIILLVSAAILFVIVSFTVNKDPSTSTQEKESSPPNKEITQSIEGEDEQTEVTKNEGTNVDYIIYVDEERYKMTKGEEKDIITTIEPLPERYPPVSLEIIQIEDKAPEEVLENLKESLQQDFAELRDVEEVTEPVEGYLLHGIDGNEATSKVVHAYIISNGENGSFILQENYFLEAAEGHGARFYHMLESFEILKE